MFEDSCAQYIRQVKYLVSNLKSIVAKALDADVAYTLLTGLPERYATLFTTLTNMASLEKPLEVMWVSNQILEEK